MLSLRHLQTECILLTLSWMRIIKNYLRNILDMFGKYVLAHLNIQVRQFLCKLLAGVFEVGRAVNQR